MPRRSTRTSPSGTRIPELFSTAVDNSATARPNPRGRSPSPGNARSPRGAHRRLDLVEAVSPNRSNDGSSARSPRNGGGGGRPRIADRPHGDGPDDDFNPETFLSTLSASDQPMLQQLGAYLATTGTQADLDFSFIRMISTIYSTPMSSLTSVIQTTRDTTTISTWPPPKRKTCPERSPWSPSFLKR